MRIKKYSEYHRIFESDGNALTSHNLFFTEAISAIGMLLEAAVSANDKESKEIYSIYDSLIGKLSTLKGSASDLRDAWKNMSSTADKIKSYIRMPKNKDADGIKKEIEALKASHDKGDMPDAIFNKEREKLRKKWMEAIGDVGDSANFPIYERIGEKLITAIDVFKKGGESLIKKLEKDGDVEAAVYAMSNRTKEKAAVKKQNAGDKASDIISKEKEEMDAEEIKKEKERGWERGGGKSEVKGKVKDDGESRIGKKTNENLIKDVKDKVKDFFGGKDKNGGALSDAASSILISQATGIRAALTSMKREIDNVISYASTLGAAKGNSAKSSASSIIAFYDKAYEYVTKIDDVIEAKKDDLEKVKKELKNIEDDLKDKIKSGGELEKWKEEVMKSSEEGMIGVSSLEKGQDLVTDAKKDMQIVIGKAYVQQKITDMEPASYLKALSGSEKGGSKGSSGSSSKSTDKSTNKKSNMKYKTFPPNPKDSDKDAITEYQTRLETLGYLKKGSYKKGVYDEPTKKATKLAQLCIMKLAHKNYNFSSEKDFRGYQLDLATYVENRADVVKKLAGDSAGSPSAYEAPESVTADKEYKTLKKGDKGEEVKEIQQKLIDLGLLKISKPTGNYAEKTTAAVKAFQTKNGISPANGVLDSKTRKKLMGDDSGSESDGDEGSSASTGSDASISTDSGSSSSSDDGSSSSSSSGSSSSGSSSSGSGSSSSGSSKGGTVLKTGSKGKSVREVQQKLMDLGLLKGITKPTGNYAEKTTAAVKAFQEANGISPANGELDSATKDKLMSANKASTVDNKSGTKTTSGSVKNESAEEIAKSIMIELGGLTENEKGVYEIFKTKIKSKGIYNSVKSAWESWNPAVGFIRGINRGRSRKKSVKEFVKEITEYDAWVKKNKLEKKSTSKKLGFEEAFKYYFNAAECYKLSSFLPSGVPKIEKPGIKK
jgi:peptidoglycan hydrolase-like protein with peptidoglycan-binding domain